MNSTLVDNATLDFLIESTKKSILFGIIELQANPQHPVVLAEVIPQIEFKISKMKGIAPTFVEIATQELNKLKPISTTEL